MADIEGLQALIDQRARNRLNDEIDSGLRPAKRFLQGYDRKLVRRSILYTPLSEEERSKLSKAISAFDLLKQIEFAVRRMLWDEYIEAETAHFLKELDELKTKQAALEEDLDVLTSNVDELQSQ